MNQVTECGMQAAVNGTSSGGILNKYPACSCGRLLQSLTQKLERQQRLRLETEQRVKLLEASVEEGMSKLRLAGDSSVNSTKEWNEKCHNLEKANHHLSKDNIYLQSRHDTLEKENSRLNEENCIISTELAKSKDVIENFISQNDKYSKAIDFVANTLQVRAEAAESQLIQKIKECNEYMFKEEWAGNEMSTALDKQKLEYELNLSEALASKEEMRVKCASAQQRLEAMSSDFTARLNESNERCQSLRRTIEQKENDIRILLEKNSFNTNEISEKLMRLKKLEDDKKHMGKVIKRLKSVAHHKNDKLKLVTRQLELCQKKLDEYRNRELNHHPTTHARWGQFADRASLMDDAYTRVCYTLCENPVAHNESIDKDHTNRKKKQDGVMDKLVKEQNDVISNLKTSLQENWKLLEERNAENKVLESTIKELKREVHHENVTTLNLVKKLEHLMSQGHQLEAQQVGLLVPKDNIKVEFYGDMKTKWADSLVFGNDGLRNNKMNCFVIDRRLDHNSCSSREKDQNTREANVTSSVVDLRSSLAVKDQHIASLIKEVEALRKTPSFNTLCREHDLDSH